MLRKLFVVCALVVVGLGAGCPAERPAGMVLYFKSGDEVFLLLADHRASDRGWAAYGGGSREGESTAETAARETEEETRGYFRRDDLLTMIEGQKPVIDRNGFALYFAEIPFVPADLVTNNPLPSYDWSYTERGPYAWIPYSELDKYLKGPIDYEKRYPIEETLLPSGQNTAWFWPIWLGNVRRAIEIDAIPWTIERYGSGKTG